MNMQRQGGAQDEPQTLTVEEAARILRIGRTAAYALAREWRATNGRSGLPVLELGRTLRVPRTALMAMLSEGRSHRPPDAA
jgi:excisionase family DNA binding protein